jgi:hypothetical protein
MTPELIGVIFELAAMPGRRANAIACQIDAVGVGLSL